MEMLGYISLAVAIVALCLAYATRMYVASVLQYSDIQRVVIEAAEEWEKEKNKQGLDVEIEMRDIYEAGFTEDAMRVAWSYSGGSFFTRLKEATKDLLDASYGG